MRKTWTEEEEKYLCENFPTENLKVMSAKLGRDIRAVRAAAQRRGLKRKYAGGRGRAVLSDCHLCWYCKHSLDRPIGYCTWAHSLIPVEGWKTEMQKSRYTINTALDMQFVRSAIIANCKNGEKRKGK